MEQSAVMARESFGLFVLFCFLLHATLLLFHSIPNFSLSGIAPSLLSQPLMPPTHTFVKD